MARCPAGLPASFFASLEGEDGNVTKPNTLHPGRIRQAAALEWERKATAILVATAAEDRKHGPAPKEDRAVVKTAAKNRRQCWYSPVCLAHDGELLASLFPANIGLTSIPYFHPLHLKMEKTFRAFST